MIFVSAGTQLPFDRLVRNIDELAPNIDEEIVVQAIPGEYKPVNVKLLPMLSRTQFDAYARRARLLVAHAGMGVILTSLMMSKPIVVLPRQYALGEHRTDHQVATAERLEVMGYVHYAHDTDELVRFIGDPTIQPLHHLGNNASKELSSYVADFIDNANK